MLDKIAIIIAVFSLITNLALFIRMGRLENKLKNKNQVNILNEDQKYWPPYLDSPKPINNK